MGPSGFGELGISTYTLVPLDKVDLSLVSVLYTQVSRYARGGARWGVAVGVVPLWALPWCRPSAPRCRV